MLQHMACTAATMVLQSPSSSSVLSISGITLA
jgi:hypothetical protein